MTETLQEYVMHWCVIAVAASFAVLLLAGAFTLVYSEIKRWSYTDDSDNNSTEE